MYAYCKKATKFTLSNICLCIIVALYAVAGAFIFQTLEQTNEKEECIQVTLSIPLTTYDYLNATLPLNCFNKTDNIQLLSAFVKPPSALRFGVIHSLIHQELAEDKNIIHNDTTKHQLEAVMGSS